MALNLLTDSKFLRWLQGRGGALKKRLEVSFVRFFSLNPAQAAMLGTDQKLAIETVVDRLQRVPQCAALVAELRILLSQTEVSDKESHLAGVSPGESVKAANSLFKAGRIAEALAMYTRLHARGGIYLHLATNIAACQLRMTSA